MLNSAKISVDAEVVCAPPALYLAYVRENLSSRIQVAGQNCYKVPKGAFTGNSQEPWWFSAAELII